MTTVTLTMIRKTVIANGGTYKKAKCYLNGQDAYYVNDVLMTKGQMVDRFMMGEL